LRIIIWDILRGRREGSIRQTIIGIHQKIIVKSWRKILVGNCIYKNSFIFFNLQYWWSVHFSQSI